MTSPAARAGGSVTKEAAMADAVEQEAGNSDPVVAPVVEAPAPDDALGDAGKKALDAERKNAKAAARERDALAARLKEFEDRDKTETQKLSERAEAAEKRAVEVESRALRLEVASEKGLTPAQAKRLVGSTREELEADVAELLETFKQAPAAPSFDGGARTPAPAPVGMNSVIRKATGRA